jgi:dTDP-4-amino-4,6-dideoxygalactose transaminase
MHTFGHPVDLDAVLEICKRWHLALVEDAAESLGSFYKGRHTGTIGLLGALSFNGNKIITTGGGGMILTSQDLGIRAKHLTTTAKRTHPYEYFHDELGFNYRLPNLNAALGCAQLEQLESFVAAKRDLAKRYSDFFESSNLSFVKEPPNCRSNYWLNSIVCTNREERDLLISVTNNKGVMTRPAWVLMSKLPMYFHCISGDLTNSEWLYERLVNLPSGLSGIYK